jgi:hypothetical protein
MEEGPNRIRMINMSHILPENHERVATRRIKDEEICLIRAAMLERVAIQKVGFDPSTEYLCISLNGFNVELDCDDNVQAAIETVLDGISLSCHGSNLSTGYLYGSARSWSALNICGMRAQQGLTNNRRNRRSVIESIELNQRFEEGVFEEREGVLRRAFWWRKTFWDRCFEMGRSKGVRL